MISVGTAFINILPNMAGFMTGVGRGLQGLAPRMAHLGRGMTRFLTLPLIGAGVAVTGLAKNFERSMQEIVGLTGTSQKQVDKWGKQILEMSKQLPQAPQELAEALYFVASSGVRTSIAMDVLRESARAAAGGLGDTQTVADVVTSAINAYGEANLKAGEATDILVNAVRLGKAEAASFAPVLGSLLPTASELNIEFDQVSGAMAALTRIGDSAAISATKVNAVLSSMIKPTDQSKEAIKKLGLTWDEVRKEAAEDFFGALMHIKEASEGDITVLGKLFPNVRALRGVLGLTGKQAEKNAVVFEKMADSAGLTDEAIQAVANTADFKFKKAMAQLQVVGIQFGNVLIPILINDIIPAIQDAVEWFGNLSDEQKKNVVKWAAIIAIAGPLLRILSPMVRLLGGLVGVVGRLTGALAGLASAKALGGVSPAVSTAATAFKKLKLPIVGAVSGIGTVASGEGIAGGAVALGGPVVIAAVAALAVAVLAIATNADEAEQNIKGVLKALGRGETDIPQIEEQIASLEEQRDELARSMGMDPTSERFLGSQQAAGIQQQIEELNTALERQREKLNRYAANLDLSTRNLNYFKTIMESASGITNKQSRKILDSINALEGLGGSLTSTERKYIRNLLKVGDYTGAMEYLNGAIDRVVRRLEKDNELKIDTHKARAAMDSFIASMADRHITIDVYGALHGGGGGPVDHPGINDPNIPGPTHSGGIVTTRQIRSVAERGPEAIVPLDEWEQRGGHGAGSRVEIVDSNLGLVMEGVVQDDRNHRMSGNRRRR